jgi:hypothetical protein
MDMLRGLLCTILLAKTIAWPNPKALHLDHRRRSVPGNAKQPWLTQQGRIRAKTEHQVAGQTQCAV